MAFSPGDVVVPFPSTDVLAAKRRPAVVVSAPDLEREHAVVWLVMVTSTKRRWSGDVPISDLTAAGLAADCFVRPAKIATASVSRIIRKAGALRPADWGAVRAVLGRYSAPRWATSRSSRDRKTPQPRSSRSRRSR
jgi:mRNA-degrading endonuclease toxin of MazEF toxin-antitoxin module